MAQRAGQYVTAAWTWSAAYVHTLANRGQNCTTRLCNQHKATGKKEAVRGRSKDMSSILIAVPEPLIASEAGT